MDERTRRPGGETSPEVHPTAPAPAPAPVDEPRPVSRRSWVIGLAVVIGIFLVGYLIYRSSGTAPPAGGRHAQQAAAGVQPVGAATVGTGDIRVIVNALGTVTPIATVTVQTQISGQLQQVAFTEGQLVKQGDFLAQVDPRPYQLLQAQYEGQLAHDQGLLAQAQVDLERYQKLAEQNSIARQQYEDQVYIVQQYQGTVKLDQAQVDQQKLNVIYCHIVSPVTGRVGLRLVDPGNYVQTTASTGLAVITQMQPITVIFPIPEDDLPDVLPTLNAGGTFQVTVYDRANVKLLATGRVIALDSQIDTTTGTVKVRAQFDNADNALFPNQFVNAQLLVKTLTNVVTVPTAAIQRGAPGTYVYVIKDGKVTVRTIKAGPTDGPMTAVTSGLSAGEQVVIDGTDRLRDGARVTVPGAAPVADTAPKNSSSSQNRRNSGSH
ncbi:MAG: efflux RND transporter periplasmic adaptor subunit [Hyphomicrobiales bacterium]|nr:efflux RND transporter periplasmic adaptor subunit [Hyphomicrobiales bacterium]